MAVNGNFPDTDALGERVRDRLPAEYRAKLPQTEFRDGRFEEWVSYLSERQPHHDEAWALEASALEIRVTREIHVVLAEAQRASLVDGAPDWFYKLLCLLHVYRAPVITLNYDNLVECGIGAIEMTSPGHPGWRRVGEEDVLGGLPKSAVPPPDHTHVVDTNIFATPVIEDRGLVESFQLMKLHGSLSWYWLPSSGSGSSLRRWHLPGRFGEPWDVDDDSRRRELPRHEPFVVPPSVLKGARLRESVAQEIWERAAASMSAADRIVLIGYSLPIADHSFGGLLTEGMGGRNVRVEVVNPKARDVHKRLVRLGVPTESIVPIDDDDCVETWVETEVAGASRTAAQSLREHGCTGDELMYVANPRIDGVPRVESRGESIVLHLDPPGQVATQPRQSRTLLDRLDGATSMVVQMNDRYLPVIGYWLTRPPGYNTNQLHFVTAGR